MSLDPEKAEGIPRKLIGMYSDTELSLLGMMADAVVKGIDTDDWYAKQQGEALRFRTAAQRLAAGLTKAAPTVVGEAVGDAVKFGHDAVDEDIDLAGHLAAKSGLAAGLQANLSIEDTASKLTRKAVADGVGTLATVNQALPGAASKLYQQVTARVNATPVSSDLTRRQAVQQALDVLTARGITGFRDSAGRNWSLSTYVEMKSRTLVNNTLMQSHIDRMLDRGLDLVVVSSHKNPAPQCQPFEGQVLSIGDASKGTTVRPNATGGEPVKVKIKATMDEARAQGFRHPNCRHSVAAFIPGASRTFKTEPDPEGYKATQQLRAMERAIRDTKRQQAVAIEPSVKKRLSATLRSQQTALKQHVAANDLKRRSLRERPDLGYRINPPDALDTIADVPKPKGPDLGDYLAAENKYKADVTEWLVAEQAFEASRPLSSATRKIIDQARADLPAGKDGWDAFQTLSKDKNGAFVPSRRLKAHLETVARVGQAVRADVTRKLAADSELADLRTTVATMAAEGARLMSAGNFKDFIALGGKVNAATIAIAKKESDAILTALSDAREFGGFGQTVRTLTAQDRTKLESVGGRKVDAVAADAVTLLREAERFFPKAWLEAADLRGPLGIGYVDRGYFLQKDSSTLDHDTITLTRRGENQYSWGAHSDHATEVMIHELGHRMEEAIPGLKQLEFALARERATSNGVLDDLVDMGGGEVTYEDDWDLPYVGRSYSPSGYSRPDLVAHEVFQTGTQDLFGRSTERYAKVGDSALEEFMIGVLTLL